MGANDNSQNTELLTCTFRKCPEDHTIYELSIGELQKDFKRIRG